MKKAPDSNSPNNGLCHFCGASYLKPYWHGGNNAEPLVPYDEGRACDDCNGMIVIPARIAGMTRGR